MTFSIFDNRRNEKRSKLYMTRVSQAAMLGIRLFKLSTDPESAEFNRSTPMENTYTDQQDKYWANRMVWC